MFDMPDVALIVLALMPAMPLSAAYEVPEIRTIETTIINPNSTLFIHPLEKPASPAMIDAFDHMAGSSLRI
jgi:hypothetical protein